MADNNDGWTDVSHELAQKTPPAAKTDDGWTDVSHELTKPAPPSDWDRYKKYAGEAWDKSAANPVNVYNTLTHVKDNIPVLGQLAKNAGYAILPTEIEDRERKKNVAEEKAFGRENPGSDLAAKALGSSFIPSLPKVFGPGGLVGKEITGIAPKVLAYLGNAASRVGYGTALSAGDAAARGEDVGKAAKQAATIGGVVEGAGALAHGVGNFVPRFVFGVKPETAEYYKGRAPQVNAADEVETADQLAANAQRLRDPFEEAKTGLSEAKLDKRAADMVERQGMRDEIGAAREAAQGASGDFDKASQTLRDSLKSKKVPDISPDAMEAAQTLRGQISAQSGKAFEVLNQQGKSIPLRSFKANLTDLQNSLKIGEHEPIMSSAEDFSKLGEMRQYLDKFGTEARPEEIKGLIQMMDQENGKIYEKIGKGEYVTRGERAMLQARSHMDDTLKEIPEYAEAMAPMGDAMDLMKRVNKVVGSGDQKRLRQAAERIGRGAAPEDEQTLRELGDKTQKDLLKPLSEYGNAQKLLQNPAQLEAELNKLPEAERSRALMDVYRQVQEKNRNAVNVSKRLEGLPETGALDAARREAESHKAWLDPVRGVNNDTSQGIVRSLYSDKRPNLANQRKVDYLDEMYNTNVAQQAKDLGVKKALSDGFANGSRNVNLGSFSLGGLAGMLGETAGKFGSAAGAVGGAMADLVGPPTYKRIMDLSMTPGFQQYSRMLAAAAQKSPQIFYIAHKMLMKNDPNYAAQIQGDGKP